METAGLSALAGLTDLGLRSAPSMRPSLLRILTDLYVQKLKHTPEEERHYTELALRLLDGVDAETRCSRRQACESSLAAATDTGALEP
jgi:hypothetical protein